MLPREFAMKLSVVRFAPLGLSLIVFTSLAPLAALPIAGQSAGFRAEPPAKPGELKIPIGTILPVRLTHALSSKNAQVGQEVTGRIMQDVPLPNHEEIHAGAKVSGKILSVQRAGNGSGGKISFRFDTLEFQGRKLAIVASLRALAGFMEVQSAQTPEFTPGFGTPYNWANTRQIGGDEVYGVGGPVTNEYSGEVGKGVYGGGLVSVSRGAPLQR